MVYLIIVHFYLLSEYDVAFFMTLFMFRFTFIEILFVFNSVDKATAQ